ncbi:glycoside hydrolase family 88 protein [Bacteroides sp. 519]|uniref:glycoside hydrolase family 88 protein n=1 Tax=Bacteroides sp. 519 TaxID=2302937 RepID=UPI0013D06BEC|nr:glycoside hydrolase family 88 protein [Bacteroides sp. 519]NDV60050.1 glycosyl hydrolase family 88 [Bacteroides sp. 519]
MKKIIRVNLQILCLFISIISFSACVESKSKFIRENIEYATAQTHLMLKNVGEPTGKNYPRSMDDSGKLTTTDMYDWTPGFFPGSLWYLYELTEDSVWLAEAEKWTASLEPLKTFTGNHDLGFMIYCSYGNALRLAPKAGYRDIIIQSAESLSTRFDERTQTIKSWNSFQSWDGETSGQFPVIVDNMMNLEMLFAASRLSGNKKYYNIAVAHANTTIMNHFRDNYSTYHVVDFDSISGKALFRGTAQGYADNSTWARGQAWIIYGFTMMYRETKDPDYLRIAINAANYYLRHLPEDLIPLWDFNVCEVGYTPDKKSYASKYEKRIKDASAACITSSALFELGILAQESKYTDYAVSMLYRLSNMQYKAPIGSNANFLIMHCVGSIPHQSEIDKPLVYADYYFLEALARYKRSK